MNNLYDVLEICLQELENGADIESVLFRYPDLADELRPILEASIKAKSLTVSDPSVEVVRRNRAKALQRAAQMRETNTQRSRRLWSVPLRRMLVSLAVIVALFVSGTGLVRAASTTLPGDNLYPVKRTWEDVRLLFTFDMQAREALEIEHDNKRLEELYELFAEGRSAKVDFAGFVTRQNGDLWLVSKIPVVISARTEMRAQSVAIGDAVRVRGFTQSDGTVLADRIELLPAGKLLPKADDDDSPEFEQEKPENENEADEDNSGKGSEGESPKIEKTKTPKSGFTSEKISLEGVVDSISGSILIVNGQPMNTASAEIKGTPKVGAAVKLEGYFDASGVFIVTKIEFLKSGSVSDNSNEDNDDNSSGDDNDNGNDDDNSSKDDDNGNNNDNDDNGDDD
jgi:hypothetical protein